LIVAVLAPMVLNALYNLQVPGMDVVDLTPVAFSITGLVLVWGLFRFRLLDLIPVGRKKVVDRIPDSVIVLDSVGRVVDVNPAALTLLNLPPRRVTGRPVVELLPALGALVSAGTSGTVSGSCSVSTLGRSSVDLAVTVSPLPDERRTPTGHLIVLRDVTVQHAVERRLRELVAERTETIAVLLRGLYPQRVPEVPASTWRHCSAPPRPRPTWAVTSSTSARSVRTAGRSSSVTSWARAPVQPRSRRWRATRRWRWRRWAGRRRRCWLR
jgi:PAS domain S-box-containing protein